MLCIRSGVKVCSKCTLYFFGGVHSKKFLSGTLFWAKKIIHLAPRGICEKMRGILKYFFCIDPPTSNFKAF